MAKKETKKKAVKKEEFIPISEDRINSDFEELETKPEYK